MIPDSPEDYDVSPVEIATFCFHKLAALEARFILLCHRAQAAGIDCTDLYEERLLVAAETGAPLQVVN